MYLSWAAYYEGSSDDAYLSVLIPRVIEDILLSEGTRPVFVPTQPSMKLQRGSVEEIAREICENAEAFHLLFVHADTGGRALEADIAMRREAIVDAAADLCGWRNDRSIFVSPRHEIEAWALVEAGAVCAALGLRRIPPELDLPRSPAAAERLVDPKAHLDRVARAVSGRRNRGTGGQLLTTIAQGQSLTVLRRATSFRAFEAGLRRALLTLGCLPVV